MSDLSQKCEDCGRGKGPNPFIYRIAYHRANIENPQEAPRITKVRPLEICPACAGKLCSALVRYHQGRKKDGLAGPRRNKNAKRPLEPQKGDMRCRNCEVQTPDWKAGEPPFCEECR